MTTLDLDKARAARAEATGERHTFVWSDETYTLPPDLPLAFLTATSALARGETPDVMAMARSLFEDDAAWDRYLAAGTTGSDIIELVNSVGGVYGLTLGESPASAARSTNGSSR
jgi:hypothetical protein